MQKKIMSSDHHVGSLSVLVLFYWIQLREKETLNALSILKYHLISQVVEQMKNGDLSMELRTWNRGNLQTELPPGNAPRVPLLDVVAIT